MKYTFHTDAGHGWLEVPRAEVRRLNIEGVISGYSYQRGDLLFLEEDCDACAFVQAKKTLGETVEFVERYTDDSPIRQYRRFGK